jgi:hypothetical protein
MMMSRLRNITERWFVSELHNNTYISYWLYVLFGFDNHYTVDGDVDPETQDYNNIVLRIVLEKTGTPRYRLSWDDQNRLLLDDRRVCRRDWLWHPYSVDGISFEGASWEEFATQDGHYYAAWITYPTNAGCG